MPGLSGFGVQPVPPAVAVSRVSAVFGRVRAIDATRVDETRSWVLFLRFWADSGEGDGTPRRALNNCPARFASAYDAGASVVHVHFRDQRPGMGHLPTWDPQVAADIGNAIREACPNILVNFTTGTIGKKGPMAGGDLGPTDGPIACLEAGLPEIAALNSGSLNYLKTTSKGDWAWDPLMFENPVSKIEKMIGAMNF